jgi:hypothetical protein
MAIQPGFSLRFSPEHLRVLNNAESSFRSLLLERAGYGREL